MGELGGFWFESQFSKFGTTRHWVKYMATIKLSKTKCLTQTTFYITSSNNFFEFKLYKSQGINTVLVIYQSHISILLHHAPAQLRPKKKKKFVSGPFDKKAKCYALFFFFFLEKRLCSMRFFFFFACSAASVPKFWITIQDHNSLSKCYATQTEVTALILAMDHALCIATDPAIGITRRANPKEVTSQILI